MQNSILLMKAFYVKQKYLERFSAMKMRKKEYKLLLKNVKHILKINNFIYEEEENKMNIYVILKKTFDTEEKIIIEDGEIQDEGAELIINPYDEYAVEEAINQRDAHGGEVTVVTVGDEDSENQLRTALAMGADQAVLINTEDDLEEGDAFTTSKILEAYFADKEADLILGGNVAIDEASGQVGPRLAELLDIPFVTTIVD